MREEFSKTKSDFEQAIFDSHLLLLGKSKLQQQLHRRLLPRSVSKWLLFRTNKSEIAKLWQIEQGEVSENASQSHNRNGIRLLFVLFPLLGLLLLIIYGVYKVPQLLVVDQALTLSSNEWLQRTNEARAMLVQGIGGLILLVGLFFTWRNIRATEQNLIITQQTTLKNLQIAEEGVATQRFSKAIELLGSDRMNIRIGGIYLLERIAKASKTDHWPIMEILTAFVRENAAVRIDPSAKLIRTDIQAVLTVIGRRNKEHERIGIQRVFRESRRLNFKETNLEGADLFGGDFAGADFSGCNLSKSRMLNTNLEHATLDRADLSESTITDSRFEGARLSGTEITQSTLTSAKLAWPSYEQYRHTDPPVNFEGTKFTACSFRNRYLGKANFKGTTFMGGNFEGTKLEGADFTGAKFEFVDFTDVDLSEVKGLSIDQIKKEGVKYQVSNLPANIRASLSSDTHVKLP